MGEEISQDQRSDARKTREGENKRGRLPQRRPECPRDFENRYKHNETNGNVNGSRMKASDELFPVCVRFAIQLNDHWQKQECRADHEGRNPRSPGRADAREQPSPDLL